MYLLFDIGGSKIRVATSTDGQSLSKPIVFETPSDFNEALENLRQAATTLSPDLRFEAIGGGVRALDKDKKNLINHPNIPFWSGKPLYEELLKIFRTSIFLENDTALVGLGEAISGAGRGHRIVVYISVSTGVGGVKIEEHKIDQNSFGFEPGQQIVDLDSVLQPIYLENLISGTALHTKHHVLASEIKDEKVWDDEAKYLAIGLNNTIVHWSPDIVVLGGTVGDHIDISKVSVYLKDYLKIFPQQPEIVRALLGEEGGLYGALEYLKQSLK